MSSSSLKNNDVIVFPIDNKEADELFMQLYWLKRRRYSRRLSYGVYYLNAVVAWIQCADPFGTKLAKPLDFFDINEAIELSCGYFLDDAPSNIESCAISKVLKKLPNDWFSSFGVIKKVAIVYQDLDIGQKGVVYKSVGFQPYAFTRRARHYSATARGNSSGSKILWARKLHVVNGRHYKIEMPMSCYESVQENVEH